MRLTLGQIAKATGGKLNGYDSVVTGVSTDSRDIPAGCLFVALKGERFDGHLFADAAVERGAAAVMCHQKIDCRAPLVLVRDTRTALLELAGFYRNGFENLTVAGLTGSVGKTTTKEMTAAVLSQKYRTLKTEGNLNNEIGVAKTLLRLDRRTEAAVVELGMNHFGEISRLARRVRPDVGVITNIGVSHIEYLGSRKGILKAKLEILEGLRKGAPLVLNGDDELLSTVREPDFRLCFFGIKNRSAAVRAAGISERDGRTEFTVWFPGGSEAVSLPAVGLHNVYDALAAFSVGLSAGVEPQSIAQGLKNHVPAGLRQRIRKVGGVTLIEDCYNASPDSQRAALNVLSGQPGRKIAVLGDMLELGRYSKKAHLEVGEYAGEKRVDVLYTFGKAARYIAEGAEGLVPVIRSFTDKRALTEDLKKELSEGDAVLFKASRAMKLEEIIKSLYGE